MLLALAFSLYLFYKIDTEQTLKRIEPSNATPQQTEITETIDNFPAISMEQRAEFENMWEISNNNDALSFDNKIKYYFENKFIWSNSNCL